MRRIERTGAFKRDFKREMRGRHRATLDLEIADIIAALAQDGAVAANRRDHALTGNWREFRDCHVRPDLVLIYRKPDPDTLQLVRLGSHSELGL
jgi:mRNA interferase YafQ